MILIVAEAAGDQRDARTGDRALKTGGLRDDEVGGHASVGPAADAEFCRISNAWGDGVIDYGHVVLEVFVAPIGKNGFAEFLAVAGRAARVGQKDGVAVGGVELRKMVKGSGVLTDRAAVRIKQRGDLFAGRVIERIVEITSDRVA